MVKRLFMKKTFVFLVPSILFGFFFGVAALAHQPRLVQGKEAVVIKNPEISQAFYGELSGQPQIFEINSANNFAFYAGLLVPDLPGIKKDIFVDIYYSAGGKQNLAARLNGPRHEWTQFYEPFAGDSYWQGPELKTPGKTGQYLIKVFSGCPAGANEAALVAEDCANQGKYVLVVGEKETFPLVEILRTIFVLPQLKAGFFDKSPLSAYFNYTGLFLLGALIVLLIVIFVVIKIIKAVKARAEKNLSDPVIK